MDVEKLLKVLNDVKADEEEIKISAKLDEIRGNVAKNSVDGFNLANTGVQDLTQQINEFSNVGSYFSNTELSVLTSIGGEHFFGLGLVAQLNDIFAGKSFEILPRLEKLRADRLALYKKVSSLPPVLESLGIKEYRPDRNEVAFVLPTDESSLNKVEKHLKEFNLLLSCLTEISGGNLENIKISRLSTGSLDFFSLLDPSTAVLLTSFLNNITGILDKILSFKKRQNEIESDKALSAEARKKILKIYEEEAEKIKEEIVKKIPDQILEKSKINDAQRSQEIKNKVRICAKIVLAWFQIGIEVDVTPLKLTSASTVEEGGNAEAPAVLERSDVRLLNQKIKEICTLPLQMKQLPFSIDDGEVEAALEPKQ